MRQTEARKQGKEGEWEGERERGVEWEGERERERGRERGQGEGKHGGNQRGKNRFKLPASARGAFRATSSHKHDTSFSQARVESNFSSDK